MINPRDITVSVDKAVDAFSAVPEGKTNISIDEATILKNERRRDIIKQLSLGIPPNVFSVPETVSYSLSQLSERVAAAQNNKTLDEINDKEIKSAYSTIYQYHIPKLEDAGWITYDSEERLVEPEPDLRQKSMEMMAIEGFLEGDQGYQEARLEHGDPRTDIHGDGEELGVNEFYETLSSSRRRLTLVYLDQMNKTSLSNISETIASIENNKTPLEIRSGERKKALAPLYQHHLPKLDQYDIVNFEKKDTDNLEKGRNFELVIPYIEEEIPQEIYTEPYLENTEEQKSSKGAIAGFKIF